MGCEPCKEAAQVPLQEKQVNINKQLSGLMRKETPVNSFVDRIDSKQRPQQVSMKEMMKAMKEQAKLDNEEEKLL